MQPVKVRKIVKKLQPRLNQVVSSLIESATLPKATKKRLKSVHIFPVDQDGGRAYYLNNTVTIPKWAFEYRRKNFLKHYAAHELAHILAYEKYGNGIAPHGSEFYSCLKKLTTDTLHFELDYKPKNAAAAGIKNNN